MLTRCTSDAYHVHMPRVTCYLPRDLHRRYVEELPRAESLSRILQEALEARLPPRTKRTEAAKDAD